MESHSPHGPHCSHLLPVPSCSVSACFWLVVAYKFSSQQLSKANVYYIFGIPPPRAAPLEHLPWHSANYQVDCGVES